MGLGLEVYNASGVKTFQSGDYLPRYQGSFFTGQYNGSYTDNNLLDPTGTPFVMYFPTTTPITSTYGQGGWPAKVSRSGATISWVFDPSILQGPDGGCCNGYIIYGLR
jgi:hypothetical protein